MEIENYGGGKSWNPLRTYYPMLCWGKLKSIIQPLWNKQFSGSEIVDGLWIANHASVCDLKPLQDRNITLIVSAALGVEPQFPRDIHYKCLPLRDVPEETIDAHFDVVCPLIRETLATGNSVLVHCMEGVSRSVTLVAAYLIRYQGMSAYEAIRFIQSKRPKANPIASFRRQLEAYENRLRLQDTTQ